MDKPKSKTTIIKRLHTERRRLETNLARLSREDILRPNAMGEWSFKDMLAHLAHWEALVAGPEPCGRKLDFLLQEMNREVNTIGSKADGLHVPELVIAAKAELEKMREQVQNAE